ncbi:MAG: ABC transporter permease, partial [Aquabacterium sp.]
VAGCAALLATLLVLERVSRGGRRFHETSLRRQGAPRLVLQGVAAALAMAGCALPLVLGFVLPAGRMAQLALAEPDLSALAHGFGRLALNSITVAGCAALLATLLALVIGYAARVHAGSAVRVAHRVASLGYAVPGAVIAVGVLIPVTRLDHAVAALLRDGFGWQVPLLLTGSIAALVYACVARYLAAAQNAVDSGLSRITPSMDQAARSLGLRPVQVLTRVHLPLLRGSALTATLLVFIDVMKELPATLVMRPFNFDTLATRVYTLASDERLAEASLPALAIVLVGLLPVVLLSRQIARERAPSGA